LQVIERLLNISSDYWSNFINIDIEITRDYGTPRLSEGNLYGSVSVFRKFFCYVNFTPAIHLLQIFLRLHQIILEKYNSFIWVQSWMIYGDGYQTICVLCQCPTACLVQFQWQPSWKLRTDNGGLLPGACFSNCLNIFCRRYFFICLCWLFVSWKMWCYC